MNIRDSNVGRIVALRRGQISQSALADQMRARGWKWSQATVWAVEKGERPLRLTEAVDLADLLHISPTELLMSEAEAGARQQMAQVRDAADGAVEAILRYQLAVDMLDMYRDGLGPIGPALTGEPETDSERQAIAAELGEQLRVMVQNFPTPTVDDLVHLAEQERARVRAQSEGMGGQ